MAFEFKGDSKFEDLGSLRDFCKNFGSCKITIKSKSDFNISLTIKSNQEIEFKVLCSKELSEILRTNNGFPKHMDKYRLLRITNKDGSKYIRVSQSIDIVGNSAISIADNIHQLKGIQGNVNLVFNIDEIKEEPYKATNLDDLIAF